MLFIDSKLTKRIKDDNGFLIIKDNPIAKAGVFDYLLSEIKSDSDKNNDKIVKVYRPFDELDRIKESFANKPIKFTHLWVGAENKMADGAIGSNIRADEKTGMLYADLIIYNPDLISAIENDKIVELSPAYTGGVVAEIGRYNGEGYEYKQNLGCINHLAVVERGRSGSDLRIADKAFEKSANDKNADDSENQEPKETQENQEQEQNAEQGATKILRAVLGDDLANKIMAKFKEFKGNQENENAEKENNQGGDDEVKSENQDKDKKEKAEKIQDERSEKMSDEATFLDSFVAYIQRFFDKKDKYKVTIKTPSGKYTYFVKAGDKEYEALSQKYSARAKKSWETRRANAEKVKQNAISQGKSVADAEREAKNAAQRANNEKRKETKRIIEKYLGPGAYSSGKGRESEGGSAEQRWGRESQGTTTRATQGGTRKANLEKMLLVGNTIAEKLKDGRLSTESKNELRKELNHISNAVKGQAGYVFGKERTGEVARKNQAWVNELEQERKGEVSKRVQKHRAKEKAEAERAGIEKAFKQGEQKRKQAETIKANINKSAVKAMPKDKESSLVKSQVKAIKLLIENDKNKTRHIARGLNEYYSGGKVAEKFSKNDILEITKKVAKAHPEIKEHLSGNLKSAIENESGNGKGRIIYRGKGGRFTSKEQGKMERIGDAMTRLVNFFKGEQI